MPLPIEVQLDRLDCCKASAARLFTRTSRREHILVDFKVLLFVFKALNGLAPSHITVLLSPPVLTRWNLVEQTAS